MEKKSKPMLCFLCYKKFQRPKILDCLHSYCQKCLQDMQQSNKLSSEKIIRCPSCRQTTQLSSGGVSGIKTNFFLVRLVKEAAVSEILKDQTVKVSCGLCPEDAAAAASRCYDCAKFLCSSCETTHNRIPVSAEHDVYSLKDCRAGKLPERPASQDGALECPKHAGEKCRFFCQTCQELICRDCTVLEHCSDKSHRYTSLQTAALGERQSTKVLVSRLDEKISELETSLKMLEKMEPALKSRADKTKAQVQAMADKIRDDVTAQEKRLLRDIRHESSQQIKELKETQKAVTASLSQARFSVDAARVFVKVSVDSEFLWLHSTLVKNLQDLVLREKPSGPQALGFMEDGGNICLGQLKKEDITEAISKEVALEKKKEKEKPARRAPPQKSTNVQSKEKDASNKENPHHKQEDIKGSQSASSNSEGESSSSSQSTKSDKSSTSTKLSSSADHDAPDGETSNKPPPSVSAQTAAPSVAAVRKTRDVVRPSDRVLRSSSRANTSPNHVSTKAAVQQGRSSITPGLVVQAETTVSSENPDRQASTRSTVQQQGRERLTPGIGATGVNTSSSSLTLIRQTLPGSSQPKPLVHGKENNGFRSLASSSDSYQADHGGNQSDTDSDDSDL